jgi:hypothetical protein
MKATQPFDVRPVLAALAMLAVLAAAYAATWRLPRPVAARPLARAEVATDTAAAPVSPRAESISPPAPEPPPCPSHRLIFEPLDPSEQPPVGLHHYVGSVGGQPATALLEWPTILGGISGTFYLHRGGPTCTLRLTEAPLQGKRPARPVLQVGDPSSTGGRSEWHLTSWPGAVLRGTWHDTTGSHPFYLRESYAGAVRANVQRLKLVGGQPYRTPDGDGDCQWGSYYYAYLQFPGPWPVAPALRRTLGPAPAVVRRRVRAAFSDGHDEERLLTRFLLNDFNLLSYHVERHSIFVGDEHGDSWTESYLFDLATGQRLTVASQLRPGYETGLKRLLKRHLLHDDRFDFVNKDHRATWVWQDLTSHTTTLPALPEANSQSEGDPGELSLTGSGLEATYRSEDIFTVSSWEESLRFSGSTYTVGISYRELRPLVRPGTPLARMLRARGLW